MRRCAGSSYISRNTGYKLFVRYQNCGLDGMKRSIAATLSACQPRVQVETLIMQSKKEHRAGAHRSRARITFSLSRNRQLMHIAFLTPSHRKGRAHRGDRH